jgi:hypothetical protein
VPQEDQEERERGERREAENEDDGTVVVGLHRVKYDVVAMQYVL